MWMNKSEIPTLNYFCFWPKVMFERNVSIKWSHLMTLWEHVACPLEALCSASRGQLSFQLSYAEEWILESWKKISIGGLRVQTKQDHAVFLLVEAYSQFSSICPWIYWSRALNTQFYLQVPESTWVTAGNLCESSRLLTNAEPLT